MIRPIKRYIKSAKIEGKILEKLQSIRSPDSQFIAKLHRHFPFVNKFDETYYALLFEEYGCSLYDFLKHNNYRGFSMPVIKEIAYDLIKAVNFLHNEAKLIHTDLKVSM